MNKLLAVLSILVVAAIGWRFMSGPDQAGIDAQRLEQDRRDRAYIEQARARKDIAALEQFIRDNPRSGWRDVAIFYRDEFAYRRATARGDADSLKRYIRLYPDSQWVTFARQRLEQLRLEQKAQRDRVDRQRKLAGRQPALPPTAEEPLQTRQQAPAQAIVEAPTEPRLDARERVQRALSIYEQQRKQKAFDAAQQKQQRKAEKDRQRQCQRLRDQLRQFDSGIRWYRLDDQGKRQFLDATAVAAERRKTEDYLRKHCR